jgi:hypothetical protein
MSHFIVLDLLSGAMDGFYSTKKMADEMLPFFNERHPNHMWIVVEVVTPKKGMRIFDTMFHTDRLGLGTHGQEK